jgi:hypothetical protein
MAILAVLLVAAGVGAILLLMTADVWLVALLTRLDTLLVNMGFGTWLAGLVTRIETRMAQKRRREGKGPGPA